MRRDGARGHANLAPRAPVNHGDGPFAAEREGVEKCVGGGVVHLSRRRQDGTDRGKKHKASERSSRRASSSTSVPRTLGSRTRAALSAVLSISGPSSRTPAAWKTPLIFPNCLRACATAAFISSRFVTSACTTSNPPAWARIATSLRRRSFSGSGRAFSCSADSHCAFGRERGTAHKHKARLKFAREMLGHREAQAAESAGDQVNAAMLQTRVLARAGKLQRFERLHESLDRRARQRWSFRRRRSFRRRVALRSPRFCPGRTSRSMAFA